MRFLEPFPKVGGGGSVPLVVGTDIPYENGWDTWNAYVIVFLDSDGKVNVQGAAYRATAPSSGQTIFTMPSGLEIVGGEQDFICYGGSDSTPNGEGSVGANPSGGIRWNHGPTGTNTFIHMSFNYRLGST